MSRTMMICMLFASLAGSVHCSAQTPRQDPRVIAQRLCDDMDLSLVKKDLVQLLNFYDSSFVATDERGRRHTLADVRKQMAQAVASSRHIDPRTTVQDVRLESDRMVVHYQGEMHFEFYDRRGGYVPAIYKETGEDTWQRKGDQWKLVRTTIFSAGRQVDSTRTARETSGEADRQVDSARTAHETSRVREEDEAAPEASGVRRNSPAPASGKTLQERQAPKVVARRLYDQLDQSKANHDLNRLLGFYDSSYVNTDERGKRVAFEEFRRQWEQIFPRFRHMDPRTTVDDVRLEGDRMVVNIETKSYFEFYDQREGWVPWLYEARGEDTWEMKGGQWKLVRGTIDRAKTQVDPKWQALKDKDFDERVKNLNDIIKCSGGCPPR